MCSDVRIQMKAFDNVSFLFLGKLLLNLPSLLEHKTCDILAAERLRLMRFDNQLITDSFQEAICILKW